MCFPFADLLVFMCSFFAVGRSCLFSCFLVLVLFLVLGLVSLFADHLCKPHFCRSLLRRSFTSFVCSFAYLFVCLFVCFVCLSVWSYFLCLPLSLLPPSGTKLSWHADYCTCQSMPITMGQTTNLHSLCGSAATLGGNCWLGERGERSGLFEVLVMGL